MKLVHVGNSSGESEAIILLDEDTQDPVEDLLLPGEDVVSITEIDAVGGLLPSSLPTGYRLSK